MSRIQKDPAQNVHQTNIDPFEKEEDRFLDLSEFIIALYNAGEETIAWVELDSEFFTISSVEYRLLRLYNRFIVICYISEMDLGELPIKWCKDISQVSEFLNEELIKFQNIEGSKFFIEENLEELAPKTPDKIKIVIELADIAFETNILHSDSTRLQNDDSLIEPSQVISTLIGGNGLRPQIPEGYVIDENDHVYIQNGAIWFGPIGGYQKYFSDELGCILDYLGVSWSSEKFVLTIKDCHNPNLLSTSKQFLDRFIESKKYLKKHRTKQDILELEEQQAVIQNKIVRLKDGMD